MMPCWRIFLFLCFIFFSISPLFAQAVSEKSNGSLTLAESVSLALANNKQIQQAKELISGAYAKIEEARSVFYPQIQLQSNYTRLNYVSSFKIALPGYPSEEIKLGPLNNYSAQVSLYQSLYTWDRNTNGVELGKIELTMAKDNTAITEREITYAVVQLFYRIQMVQEAIKVIYENLKLLDGHLSVVKKKFDAGELSNFDLLSVEVQISTTAGQKLDAETSLNKLEIEFNKMLGRPADSPLILEYPNNGTPKLNDKNIYQNNASEKRIELKQIQNKKNLAELQKKIVSSMNKPDINLFFNWNIKNGYLPNIDILRGNWYTGLMISYPLFDGFRTNSQVNQSEANIRSVQLEYENVNQSIQAEIRQALLELSAAEKKIKIEKIRMNQAEEAFTIAEEQFKNGHLSTLDLLDSQQSLKNAKLNFLLSLLNHRLSVYALDKAAGRDFQIQ